MLNSRSFQSGKHIAQDHSKQSLHPEPCHLRSRGAPVQCCWPWWHSKITFIQLIKVNLPLYQALFQPASKQHQLYQCWNTPLPSTISVLLPSHPSSSPSLSRGWWFAIWNPACPQPLTCISFLRPQLVNTFTMSVHSALTHLNNSSSYVRMLLINFR